MRIGIMGAGSVGCYVGGRLLATRAAEVVFVGRQRVADELTAGLTTTPLGGVAETVPAEQLRVETDPAALAECDAVLVCVKSGATAEVGERLETVLPTGALLVSLQNGVRNAATLRGTLPERTVLAGVVGFNVVSQGEGRFRHTTRGGLLLEAHDAPQATALFAALRATGIALAVHEHLAPHQWAKLLVNLNNAVSALSGAPTAALLLDPGYRRVVRALLQEGLRVLRAAGIRPARLHGAPIGALVAALGLPTPLVRWVARAQLQADPEARSSMWEDVTRGRPTEVDLLNGEIVRIADKHGAPAPLNQRVVALVHEVETARAGCPGWSADALWRRLTT